MNRSWATGLAVVVLGLSMAGCGSVAAVPDAADGDDPDGPALIDAAPIDAVPPPCDPRAPFGTASLLAGASTAANEINAAVSADELQIYVSSTAGGGPGGYDLRRATRGAVGDGFGTQLVMGGLNSAANEEDPTVTVDGLSLYVATNGPAATTGSFDIAVATRNDSVADFGALAQVSGVNSTASDYNPHVNQDGTILYFTSDRTADTNLYRATRASTAVPFSAPLAVGELNSTDIEDSPLVSRDGLGAFFSSNRPGGVGAGDIWFASRTTVANGFGIPVNVGELNTTDGDWPLSLSEDGCRIYFGSNRPGGIGGYDIYVAARP